VRTCILGPDEWPKVEQSGLGALLPYIAAGNVAVVVVEDDAGKVLACMSVLQATHLEGAWVDPEYRKNPGVVRALLRQAGAIAEARGESWVFAGAADDVMRTYLWRLGGARVPMDTFCLPVGG
jgi:ribosomal protein S18 acetylase RimI-like enzyme